ncbi:aminoacyl-histidine dipeptidase [Alginatibacterium sediminis]|uniref:Cytosol non-specific dipeptidase n=1 Tax=Alginatibacterium sediminis TaxID=2164068 RepID=A0A420E8C8_9ALTE|nr:aminoacyl-histidine dipeptidase [Alginatibacterium sediminis]RKF15759.1 aminoacyl-histidine dipeptidase [Alginatibacterium sediminis]
MSELSMLQPNELWRFFSNICAIPRPSKHEQALSDWIVSWAQTKKIDYQIDSIGNIILKKAATSGYEDRQTVALQAHLDMVPQANSDSNHNFTTDPIQAYVDGDWVTAKGTTLGADNGIGLASILAVFDASDIAHGPIEALLTIDEEAGMTGAFGLEPGILKASILLNTDSEQEGEVYMGCAGGGDTSAVFEVSQQRCPADAKAISISISGLKGGHSGCDIDTGRANANKLMLRLLAKAQSQSKVQIASLHGGSLRNAIPREAKTSFVFEAAQLADMQHILKLEVDDIAAEYANVETNLSIELNTIDAPVDAISTTNSAEIIASLNACPNGIISMSQDIQGIVETSLNLGVIRFEANQVSALILARSLSDSGRLYVESMLASLFELTSASLSHSGAYPGWKPDTDSKIMKVVQDSYQELFNKRPNIMVIHAGLECGLFKTAYPDLDMVSFGPTIKFPHSPDEKVEIATVARYWELMKKTLANIPVK